jgi:hypothetical protein
MAKHHPDLIMCRKQPGIAIGRLCEKCDGNVSFVEILFCSCEARWGSCSLLPYAFGRARMNVLHLLSLWLSIPLFLLRNSSFSVFDRSSAFRLFSGKCVVCDSYVRPATLVRVCDECNYGSFQGRCVICGGAFCFMSLCVLWRHLDSSDIIFLF